MQRTVTAAVGLILGLSATAHAQQFGSQIHQFGRTIDASGWTSGAPTYVRSFTHPVGTSHVTAIQGGDMLLTSHNYTVRLPDGRVLANTHQLGIDPGGSYFGSGRASGGQSASAGGTIFGPAAGRVWAGAEPSHLHPAFTQTRSHSYPAGPFGR